MTTSKHSLQNELPGFYHRKNVLVCGGAGFIGSHVVDFLTAFGAEVTVIDPCMPGTGGKPENLSDSKPYIKWYRCPIEEISGVIETFITGSNKAVQKRIFGRQPGINASVLPLIST